MSKAKAMTHQPHLIGVEETLRERKGVMLLYLLTDEAGAMMIRDTGTVPEYIRDQAAKALDWCATDYRAVVTGETVRAGP